MLKLNASYSKKVPAEGEYSSQSYHASIECELPDGLNANQLQERIHDTFELVRQSGNRTRRFRPVRNRSAICSTLPGCAASRRSRSPRSSMLRMSSSFPDSSVPVRSTNGGLHDGNTGRTAAGTALVVFGTEYVPQHLSGAIHVPNTPKSSGLRSVSRSGAPFTPH